jgi:hypothetical protein
MAATTKSRSQPLTAARIRPATSNHPGAGGGANGRPDPPDWDAAVVDGRTGPAGVAVVVDGDPVPVVGVGWAVAELGASHSQLPASSPTTSSQVLTDRAIG